jgi:hypothetical protein
VKLRPAAVVPSPTAAPFVREYSLPDDKPNPQRAADELADHDKKKGDRHDEDWVPKEYDSSSPTAIGGGMAKWKDTGVYLDGKPVGFLTFGELPIALKVDWVKDKIGAEIRPGTNDPGWKWGRQRYYRFTDYLKAIGVDVHKVKELHVVGPHTSQTLIVKTSELLSPAANDFLFRFGGIVTGKPIPHTSGTFGNGKIGDKINGVMIYVDKTPPTLKENEGLFLDGKLQDGIPYYGEPLRGGIRVYLDDRYVASIKRQELDAKKATKASDGEPAWSFAEFLKAHGVDTKGVVEVWVVRDDERKEHFDGSQLDKLIFEASSQAKGGVMFGPTEKDLVRANVIALHTRHLKPEDMPVLLQDDE